MKQCFKNDWLPFLYVGVTSNAEIDSEDVFVLKVNVELDNVHVLQQNGNVTQMCVKIVGPGNLFFTLESYWKLYFGRFFLLLILSNMGYEQNFTELRSLKQWLCPYVRWFPSSYNFANHAKFSIHFPIHTWMNILIP